MSNENKFPLKKENTDVAKENREKRNRLVAFLFATGMFTFVV
jgi:hypothetical protein